MILDNGKPHNFHNVFFILLLFSSSWTNSYSLDWYDLSKTHRIRMYQPNISYLPTVSLDRIGVQRRICEISTKPHLVLFNFKIILKIALTLHFNQCTCILHTATENCIRRNLIWHLLIFVFIFNIKPKPKFRNHR